MITAARNWVVTSYVYYLCKPEDEMSK